MERERSEVLVGAVVEQALEYSARHDVTAMVARPGMERGMTFARFSLTTPPTAWPNRRRVLRRGAAPKQDPQGGRAAAP